MYIFCTIIPPDLLRPSPAPCFKTLHHIEWLNYHWRFCGPSPIVS